ncbi:MAG: DUF2304 domain-containing protein [Symbiobacteriia bacterium]
MNAVQLTTGSLALVFGAIVLDLMRRHRISEREGLPWLGLALLLMAAVALRRELDLLAWRLGVAYAPTLWIIFGIIALLTISLRLAVGLSQLQAKVIRLTQELALLREENAK